MQHLCDLRDTIQHHWSPATSNPPFYRECCGFGRAFFTLRRYFTLHSFLLVLRPPWGRQFNLNVSRASCWSSKHSPSPTICLNHSNPQKFYTGRFYLRGRASQSRNINLYRELALPNVSFEMFASHGIWTLFTDR